MAELLLKVGTGANYSDGDVLCAFNRRHIRCVHAQMLCHVKNAGFNRDGLRPADAVARDLREACCQYRFERTGQYEIERVTMADGSRERITGPEFDVSINGSRVHHVTFPEIKTHRENGKRSRSQIAVLIAALDLGLQAVAFDGPTLTVAGVPVPFAFTNTNPQFMDVETYIRRRLKHDRHAIFGAAGAEFWYGGRTDHSHAAMNVAWNAIETKTPRRESEEEFQLAPLGRLDIRHHLAVRWREFDDATAESFIRPKVKRDLNGEPVIDAETQKPVIEAKRERHIDWRADLVGDIGVAERDVDDRDVVVGHEIPTGDGRLRYTSKTQPVQTVDERIKTRATQMR